MDVRIGRGMARWADRQMDRRVDGWVDVLSAPILHSPVELREPGKLSEHLHHKGLVRATGLF